MKEGRIMQQLMDHRVRLSVRNLVEFIMRSGDLDNRRSSSADREAMLAGGRIHRKIQKQMGDNYEAEVALKVMVPLDEIELILEGRADGILKEGEAIIIDEIKGMYQDVMKMQEPIPVHRAQAVCYAYMYMQKKEMDGIWIQMTYCNLDTEEIQRFREYNTADQIKSQFFFYIQEYGKWAKYLYRHRLERKQSIRGMEFPFPYRKGQRDIVVSVYRAILRETRLFIQAPTGIGKTISVTFPAVKAIGEGYGDKIFYLTAKTITRTGAEESFEIMRKQGMKLSSVTITAKEKLCILDEMDCNPISCPRAKGHFDRVNQAVFDLITNKEKASREVILSYAEKYQVCPFELCLDVSNWMDAIICDYNYVLDPNIRLQRYFADNNTGDYIFLMDEAHNLVERAREMYSAALIKEDFLEAKKRMKTALVITKKIDRCNRIMLQLKRECDTWKELTEGEGIGAVVNAVEALFGELQKWEEAHPEYKWTKEDREFFFSLRNFLMIYDRMDENYRVYTQHLEDGRFLLKLFCVNPANAIRGCLEQGIAAIFFSATMLPIRYYKELLSGEQNDYAIYAHSPFDTKKRLLLIGSDVSSRYTRRVPSEFGKIVAYIEKIVRAKRGNYLVFFPSYGYMMDVLAMIEKQNPNYEYQVQKNGMTEREREQFLEQFSNEHGGSFVGFCVSGGIFSEGIDLKGERLIGVVLIGTGLPQICSEREILKKFYAEREMDGFAYAYRYPGINKVFQAAGRLIRTENDYGVIVLLEDRLLKTEYTEQFPVEWSDYQVTRLNEIEWKLQCFWNKIVG